jgi:uncharacterized protein YecE (DUF72 family)
MMDTPQLPARRSGNVYPRSGWKRSKESHDASSNGEWPGTRTTAMPLTNRVLVGTSGWSYDHWRDRFYPPEMSSRDWLGCYAGQLRSVEINSTFYRLPSEDTLRAWRDAVPPDFVFSVKASRYITHTKKLRDPRQTLPPLLERIGLLGAKLGPILFQLPPRWRRNVDRLAEFLEALSSDFRYAFEFRDPSWLEDDILALLADHRAACCIYDLDGFLSPPFVTGDFVYVRLHGPNGPYHGCYTEDALAQWRDTIAAWQAGGRDVYCYFDNDEAGYAPINALSLQALLSSVGA